MTHADPPRGRPAGQSSHKEPSRQERNPLPTRSSQSESRRGPLEQSSPAIPQGWAPACGERAHGLPESTSNQTASPLLLQCVSVPARFDSTLQSTSALLGAFLERAGHWHLKPEVCATVPVTVLYDPWSQHQINQKRTA
eukprot:scaffold377_cov563-Prasinococcus_capsulatus_cf.AAC.25